MSHGQPPKKVLISYAINGRTVFVRTIDASISEIHGVSADISDHNVEIGQNPTDHIRPKPTMLSLQCLITSDDPNAGYIVGTDFTKLKAIAPSGYDYVGDTYAQLRAGVEAGAIFSVTTTLDKYDNMGVTNFSVPRSAENGTDLLFDLDLKVLNLIDTGVVTAPEIRKQKRSTKPSKEATPAAKTETKKSYSASFFDKALK